MKENRLITHQDGFILAKLPGVIVFTPVTQGLISSREPTDKTNAIIAHRVSLFTEPSE